MRVAQLVAIVSRCFKRCMSDDMCTYFNVYYVCIRTCMWNFLTGTIKYIVWYRNLMNVLYTFTYLFVPMVPELACYFISNNCSSSHSFIWSDDISISIGRKFLNLVVSPLSPDFLYYFIKCNKRHILSMNHLSVSLKNFLQKYHIMSKTYLPFSLFFTVLYHPLTHGDVAQTSSALYRECKAPSNS